jgi:hypothetical protein
VDEHIEAAYQAIAPINLLKVGSPRRYLIRQASCRSSRCRGGSHLRRKINSEDLKATPGQGQTEEPSATACVESRSPSRLRKCLANPRLSGAKHYIMAGPDSLSHHRKLRVTIDRRPTRKPDPIEIVAKARFMLCDVQRYAFAYR